MNLFYKVLFCWVELQILLVWINIESHAVPKHKYFWPLLWQDSRHIDLRSAFWNFDQTDGSKNTKAKTKTEKEGSRL